MKSKFLLSFLAICATALLFWSNSGGAAAGGNGNRTGSPGSSGNCTSCHSGGSFAPITTIDITNSQGSSVTSVMGDSTYTISVSVSASSGTPSGYGFQAIIVDDSTNNAVGTLSTSGGVRTSSTAQGQVAEQNATSASGTFTFSWTAPSTGSGNFTIYAYGNAVNGNSGGTGDAAAGDSYNLLFTPSVISSIANANLREQLEVKLFPNPVVNQLNIAIDAAEDAAYQLSIVAANGQQLRQEQIQAPQGGHQLELDVTDLPVGAYRLLLQDEQGRSLSKPFVKF